MGPLIQGNIRLLKLLWHYYPRAAFYSRGSTAYIHRYYDGTFSTFMLPICNRRLKYGVLYSCWDQCAWSVLHCSSEFHVCDVMPEDSLLQLHFIHFSVRGVCIDAVEKDAGKNGKLNESKDFLDFTKPGDIITRGCTSIEFIWW